MNGSRSLTCMTDIISQGRSESNVFSSCWPFKSTPTIEFVFLSKLDHLHENLKKESASRILEKRNSLQMSQVFRFPYIGDQRGVAFQGFYKRDRRTGKVIGFPHQLYMHAQIKRSTAAALREEVPGFSTQTDFGPAVSEAASPKRCCSHAVLLP